MNIFTKKNRTKMLVLLILTILLIIVLVFARNKNEFESGTL